ncbi:hypothetical protein [Microcoleus asticus]|uniref:Uncharacterized protein n=1 Tax=Microcoleus asticus IPMA8 TaxID=2563858 RepID=A0ABX2D974_9CYAN|nr:hypothetical protein [Microcoleus asticus]NQE38445.1 hypothetical protein [Microcoleus asticus IPMA8]
MHLKLFALSGTALALWLSPLIALDKRIGWHKSVQGLSLGTAIACAVQAGNIARKLSAEGEIETIKTRAITADVIDEISTSAYISQQERQNEAERILNGAPERSEDVERLERLMALTCDETELVERSEQTSLTKEDSERLERILQLKARGYGKAKIILELWGVNKGGSAKYKAAEAEYNRLVDE